MRVYGHLENWWLYGVEGVVEGLKVPDLVVAQALRFAVGAKIFSPDRAKIRNVQITRLGLVVCPRQ